MVCNLTSACRLTVIDCATRHLVGRLPAMQQGSFQGQSVVVPRPLASPSPLAGSLRCTHNDQQTDKRTTLLTRRVYSAHRCNQHSPSAITNVHALQFSSSPQSSQQTIADIAEVQRKRPSRHELPSTPLDSGLLSKCDPRPSVLVWTLHCPKLKSLVARVSISPPR